MPQAIKPLAVIAAIVFLATIALAGVLSFFELGTFSVATVARDGLILALIISPSVYWLVLLPASQGVGLRSGSESSRLAITDPLTRIMNRRGVTISLLEAMAYAERYENALSVAMIDIDQFDEINNRHGREIGNKVLVEIAAIIGDAVRMPDKMGRYGGEEFMLILPATSAEDAKLISERIAASVTELQIQAEEKVRCTVSIGVAQFRKGEDLEQLMSRVADILAQAKKSGNNTVLAE
ncbi:MAG: hypothetical protein BMS9Abin11_0516 [Gammaproteobacteria bacterium]|nr:MAG: hypothetical protein BMS9Abin11_0516 [Gammaproteobacteria bacterium]